MKNLKEGSDETYKLFADEYLVELFSLSIENPFPHLNDVAEFLKKSNLILNTNLLMYFRSILLSQMSLKWSEPETEVLNQLFFNLNSQVQTDDQTRNYGERISKLLRYRNVNFLQSDEALQTAWNSEIFNMIFSNLLQMSSESVNDSVENALAAVALMEKKFDADSTFLVDFYAKFQLRKAFNLQYQTRFCSVKINFPAPSLLSSSKGQIVSRKPTSA